jgi:protein-S-isoprenylcysteine O-methyltransferase Ste14
MTMGFTIDWAAIGEVFGVGFVAAVGIVVVYTVGLRLLGVGQPQDAQGETTTYAEEAPRSGHTPPAALAGAGLCFAVGAAAVLYGIWLTIPQFH